MGPVEAPFMPNLLLFEEIQTVSSDKTLLSLSYFPIFPFFLKGKVCWLFTTTRASKAKLSVCALWFKIT